MPRVANPPRATAQATSKHNASASPFKTPLKMPMYDDAQEKAARLQSRQALHDLQLNQIRAAASPMRKLNSFNRAASNSPQGASGPRLNSGKVTEEPGLIALGTNSASPVKRVPILANFEEWMKMATDNKINATNSWNFALIDYFHDMSLLKEGDGVNFQKASCTLDGCVKIYTSRVDSVATETGKLLSGLTDNDSKNRKGAENDQGAEADGGDDDDDDAETGSRKRAKKRAQRSSEATLASSFAQLQLKKFDLEFSVDPLFKKASADFDEGGAKGLLLNHLVIDSQGRIVFDSSDDPAEDALDLDLRRQSTVDDSKGDTELSRDDAGSKDAHSSNDAADIDISPLIAKFFPDLDRLDTQDICPSLKNSNLGDPAGSLDVPFLKAPEDWRQEHKQTDVADRSGILLDDEGIAGFDDDEDMVQGGFDLPPDTGFGEGGEVWAKEAALETRMPVHQVGNGDDAGKAESNGLDGGDVVDMGIYDVQNENYGVSLDRVVGNQGEHEGVLGYFDEALRKNWAGPEHWRILKIKDMTKSSTPAPRARREKEPFEIDFTAGLDPALAEALNTSATSSSTISLPKSQWKSKTRNLLPDDKHFNSRHLVRLFLKPKALIGRRQKRSGRIGAGQQDPSGSHAEQLGEMDEGYWAREGGNPDHDAENGIQGNYDANFFQDDGLAFPAGVIDDDDDFADARETFSPDPGAGVGDDGTGNAGDLAVPASQEGGYGSQLVTQNRRVRPEYVQYARAAKKVDVRRLKEEIWKGMNLEERLPMDSSQAQLLPSDEAIPKPEEVPLKFTSVMKNLQTVYPEQAMADISTSYCFICLLHLANEKGLQIASQEDLTELNIRRDLTAEITGEEG